MEAIISTIVQTSVVVDEVASEAEEVISIMVISVIGTATITK